MRYARFLLLGLLLVALFLIEDAPRPTLATQSPARTAFNTVHTPPAPSAPDEILMTLPVSLGTASDILISVSLECTSGGDPAGLLGFALRLDGSVLSPPQSPDQGTGTAGWKDGLSDRKSEASSLNWVTLLTAVPAGAHSVDLLWRNLFTGSQSACYAGELIALPLPEGLAQRSVFTSALIPPDAPETLMSLPISLASERDLLVFVSLECSTQSEDVGLALRLDGSTLSPPQSPDLGSGIFGWINQGAGQPVDTDTQNWVTLAPGIGPGSHTVDVEWAYTSPPPNTASPCSSGELVVLPISSGIAVRSTFSTMALAPDTEETLLSLPTALGTGTDVVIFTSLECRSFYAGWYGGANFFVRGDGSILSPPYSISSAGWHFTSQDFWMLESHNWNSLLFGLPMGSHAIDLTWQRAAGLYSVPAQCYAGELIALPLCTVSGDSDCDGAPDVTDDCPTVPNVTQVDADGDGSGDACDVCTNDPDNDADDDGICADSGYLPPKTGDNDNCPDTANPGQEDNVHPNGIGDHCDDPDGDLTPDVSDVCPDDADNDGDGDGVCNGSAFQPPKTGGNDNCPNTANSTQENDDGDAWGDACDYCASVPTAWFTPAGDGDCDGFSDAGEVFAGTDPADACPDDLNDDAWPADMADLFGYGAGHHDGVTDIFDINELTPPYFNRCDPDPLYTPRKDFSGLTEYVPDGCVNIFDIALLTPPMFGKHCTP
jgi:hypothetical protein